MKKPNIQEVFLFAIILGVLAAIIIPKVAKIRAEINDTNEPNISIPFEHDTQ
jgi:hypothetical protein